MANTVCVHPVLLLASSVHEDQMHIAFAACHVPYGPESFLNRQVWYARYREGKRCGVAADFPFESVFCQSIALLPRVLLGVVENRYLGQAVVVLS